MPKTKSLRDETKYRLLPPLDDETYAGLRANIAVNGVQVPVVKGGGRTHPIAREHPGLPGWQPAKAAPRVGTTGDRVRTLPIPGGSSGRLRAGPLLWLKHDPRRNSTTDAERDRH